MHNAGRLPLLPAAATLLLLSVHVPAQAQDPRDSATCIECHVTEAVGGQEISIGARLAGSVHEGMECVDCHGGIDAIPHDEDLPAADCAFCHSEAAEVYTMHGRVMVGEAEDIPNCAACHGTHRILAPDDPESPVNARNLPATCGECHENIDLATKHEILYGEAVSVYRSSVHGQALAGGVSLAASCNDCHSSGGSAHRIFGPARPESTINHFNIPKTCGKCHAAIEHEFWAGIHGKLVARGETDAPVCTHCHGEHGIIPPSDPRSPVSPTRVAQATCAPCHESASLNEKYGIPTGRLRTWYDSYHGLKSRAGDITVANCASCHAAHLILPQTDPASSIHSTNLRSTCGNCHPGISAAMAKTPIHGTPGISQTPAANVVRVVYIIAIIVIIGAMAVHWLLDLLKQIRLVRQKEQVRRMTYNEVWQHWTLMISFVVLVISGFSLRYSESFWVDLMFGWEGGFPLRGIIHRAAAVVFTATAVWHLLYLTTRRGREFIRDAWPRSRDFAQFFQTIGYNLGLRRERPKFGRFGYVEKAEYWALVWGTAVMIVSGFLLWFDNVAVRWLPKGVLDVMLVIHYYEAWLATLAILIWHLYSTVFSPSVYPMNPSWIDGRMPQDMLDHERERSKKRESPP